jgi:hypothetical protein
MIAQEELDDFHAKVAKEAADKYSTDSDMFANPSSVPDSMNCHSSVADEIQALKAEALSRMSKPQPQVPYELPMNVYQRNFKGHLVDTYDITDLYNVTNPAAAHALKKLLVTGGRSGNKTRKQDYLEAIKSIYRAIELEGL